ncbi:permease [Desulfobulbus alkaliphilus]|uniref:permease n=1 Tax=Desulfobulbus alkaliphilus TaxID=869814 RepID=UPI0019630393|nr:permease [Desulfobulbus alkaliphilus]MBM9537726.1 permease [Desulfobulbus alkaliphilus]
MDRDDQDYTPRGPIPMYQPVPASSQAPGLSQALAWLVGILFLTVSVLLFFLGRTPAWHGLVNNIAINFLAIMVEALPFMLIGALAGGLIEVFVPVAWIEKMFHRHRTRSVLLAGTMGLFFPVCECAIIPVVRRLLGKGIPLAAALTFLLAGPIVNVIVAFSTAVAYNYDWVVVAVRLGSGYCIAVCIGLLLGRWFNRDNGILPEWRNSGAASCGHQSCAHDRNNSGALADRVRHALGHACDDFFSVGFYLVIGAFIAALVRSITPMDIFSHLLANPEQAIVLMMIMAMLLNLCSEADAFIAASFRGVLPGSAQMAFMVLGPMLDVKLLLMYFSVFRKRLIIALSLSVFIVVLLWMIGLQTFFPALLL